MINNIIYRTGIRINTLDCNNDDLLKIVAIVNDITPSVLTGIHHNKELLFETDYTAHEINRILDSLIFKTSLTIRDYFTSDSMRHIWIRGNGQPSFTINPTRIIMPLVSIKVIVLFDCNTMMDIHKPNYSDRYPFIYNHFDNIINEGKEFVNTIDNDKYELWNQQTID